MAEYNGNESNREMHQCPSQLGVYVHLIQYDVCVWNVHVALIRETGVIKINITVEQHRW